MDAARFDALARSLSVPRSRRAALSGAAAGGFLSVLGLTRSVSEARAIQGGACVVTFAAQLLQGPSTQQALITGGGLAGEVRGELSFSLMTNGKLDNAALTLADGTSLPVVGQAMGHSLQLRIALGPQGALVAVGVGEQEISRCQGAIDGVATGPQRGDLGDWHAAGVQQARGGQGSAVAATQDSADVATQGSAAGAASGAADAGTEPAGRGATGSSASGGGSAPRGATGGGTAGSGPTGSGAASPDATGAQATVAETTVPSCPAGATYCDYVEECRDLRTSPLDCGACGTRCPSLICQEGRCLSEAEAEQTADTALDCGPGETFCGGVCVDLQTDPLHCGQCGRPCASELGAGACIDGACACSPGTTRCNDVCVNTDRDPLNCGGCGTACAAGEDCFNSACTPGATACPGGQTQCAGTCVDLNTDPDNCGACGTLCPVSPEIFNCEGGVCVPPSCDPLVNCGGLCVDLQTDSLHCGTCGTACPAGQTCVGGTCAPATTAGCPAGQVLCGTECRKGLPTADGGITCSGGGAPPTTCPPGQSLCNGACYAEGACQPADCPPGYGRCYGICKDFMTDPGYCGSCSNACPGGICTGGACTTCATGLTPCGTACVDTATDLNNCGFCGNLCGTLCIDGRCTGVGPAPTNTCAAGQTRCGDVCIDTAEDNANCGQCGNVCNEANVCSNGRCVNSDAACLKFGNSFSACITRCADTRTDPEHCGGCFSPCGEGSECRGGLCTVPSAPSSAATLAGEEALASSCPEGQVDCGGGCTDLTLDPLNCGGCGVNCGADPCVGSVCTPAQPQVLDCAAQGLTDCDGLCVDTATDPANCGACGGSCGPGIRCDFGVCGEDPALPEPPETAAEEPVAAPEEPAECLAAGGACDPTTPGVCCSGACNDDGTCA